MDIAATDEIELTATLIEAVGRLEVTNGAIFNEASADVDFRVESNDNTHMLFVDGGNNRVGVGTTPDLGVGLHVRSADSGASVEADADELVVEVSGNVGMSFLAGSSSTANIFFGDSDDADTGRIFYNNSGDSMNFNVNALNFMKASHGLVCFNEDSADRDFRIESNSDANAFVVDAGSDFIRFFGSTPNLESNASDDYGVYSDNTGETVFSMNGLSCKFNRQNSDGAVVSFYQEASSEGTISVSGTTIAYNTFCGSHWSRLADNSKPTILRGTVMESIATMMDWYQVEYDTDTSSFKKSISLPDGKSVGDDHTITVDGIERTGKIIKEGNEQLPKCKISDAEDSKAVYGVFMAWDDNDDGLDGDVNDMYVASLGAFVVRSNSSETVAIGDYLQSNGDGTAKVQADDILRASTIAKVTSTEKTHIHADGSYCVPCTLHCG